MSDQPSRLPSVPSWTAIPASRSRALSESSSEASSHNMQEDELAATPAPSSPARPHVGHKRKGERKHKMLDSAYKRRRISDRVGALTGDHALPKTQDLPASAHAAPVRKPSGSLATHPHPPVIKAQHVSRFINAKRSFDNDHGPAPSTSASLSAPVTNPHGPGPNAQRPVARKTSGGQIFGRRRSQESQLSSLNKKPTYSSATTPPRARAHGRASEISTGFTPEQQSKPTNKKTQPIPRSHTIRQINTKSPTIIEISDSDEEPVVPPRSQLPSNSQKGGIPTHVIELTESDTEPPRSSFAFSGKPEPIVISSSNSESEDAVTTGVSASTSRGPDVFRPPRSADTSNISAYHENSPSSTSIVPEFAARSREHPLEFTPLGIPPSDPAEATLHLPRSHAEVPLASGSPRLVDNGGIGLGPMVGYPPEQLTARSAPFARASSVPPQNVFKHVADKRISEDRPPESGVVETLVPALDDMELASSNVSSSSDSPMRYDADVLETQTVGTDPFEDWSARDGSGAETSLIRGASVSEDQDEPAQPPVSTCPVTPPRRVSIIDLSSVTQKKRSTRNSNNLRLKHTPVTPSSVPPPLTANHAIPTPTRAAKSLSGQQVTMMGEVRGHLYGGDGGFFKVALMGASPNGHHKTRSCHEASPISQDGAPVLASLHIPSQAVCSMPDQSLRCSGEERSESQSLLNPQDQPIVHAARVASPGTERLKKPVPIPRKRGPGVPKRHVGVNPRLGGGEPDNEIVPARLEKSLPNTAVQARSHFPREADTTLLCGENVPMAMVSRSGSPDASSATAVASALMHVRLEGDANTLMRAVTPSTTMTPGRCGGHMHGNGVTSQVENADDDDKAVQDILLDSGCSSPEQIDLLHGQRRSIRRTNGSTPRSNSSSSELQYILHSSARSPAMVPVPHMQPLRMDSGGTRALVRRMRDVEVSSGDEDGGMSWVTYGKVIMREYANIRLRAKDIPHTIQDFLNTCSPLMKQTPDYVRSILKAIIRQNTAEVEPNAPEINIINEVDDELCPSLEFYYTNYMWHSDSVPLLDASQLKGCGCYPVCLPGSNCSCLRRQQEFYDMNMSGFNYSRGHLRYEEYPVFECNALCGCEDDCRNRVVQHGRKHAINIEKTREKGWGVFAGERIPAKTFVGVYSGEFITDTEGESRGRIYHLGDRTYLFDIDFWHLKKGKKNWEVKYCVDAFHVGNFTRYLNHSCEPNCVLVPVYINEPDVEKPMLAIFTSKDVQARQELCFSYFGSLDDEEEQPEPSVEDDIFISCKCGSSKCTGRIWRC